MNLFVLISERQHPFANNVVAYDRSFRFENKKPMVAEEDNYISEANNACYVWGHSQQKDTRLRSCDNQSIESCSLLGQHKVSILEPPKVPKFFTNFF